MDKISAKISGQQNGKMVQDNSPVIEVDQEKEKLVETHTNSLRRLESIVKSTAWIVIVLSASFHIYRLFQYGRSIFIMVLLFYTSIVHFL